MKGDEIKKILVMVITFDSALLFFWVQDVSRPSLKAPKALRVPDRWRPLSPIMPCPVSDSC